MASLVLDREPRVLAPAMLPQQRCLRLWLRNAGDAPVALERRELRLLDRHGADLRAAATPSLLALEPGDRAPLDLVYRARPGTAPPARLEHAGGTLELPAPTSAPRA